MQIFQLSKLSVFPASILPYFITILVLIAACTSTQRAGQESTQEYFFDPVALFLTWQNDPATSMTIDWHTTPDDLNQYSVLEYKVSGGDEWRRVYGNSYGFPHSKRTIHRVELRGLNPSTRYRFRFGENSQSYYFETMPADLREPLQFATGGIP